ncbi:MAG TPA: 2OG-Fe(II) oxygenase [Streptosporangiaceae bacterium]|nr:2OG-Fe(II) oxygenase [Streptosporangiaceae bacterium]
MELAENMLGSWVHSVDELAVEFSAAQPFPLVVLDGFLTDDAAEGLLAEFPSIDAMTRSNDYMFADKRVSETLANNGPMSKLFHDLLLSNEFADILSRLSGRTLFVDSSFHGGGFHQAGDGGYLDTHVDFNIHPHHDDWLRVLNVLLFLNKDWEPAYEGNLLVRTDPTDEPRSVAPLFNRGVVMLTSDHTYHGYRRMTLPPGVTRKSIAAYAYELIPAGSLQMRTTAWAPEGGGILKRSLAKHWTGLAATRDRVTRRR